MSKHDKPERMLLRVMRVAAILAKAERCQPSAPNPTNRIENQDEKSQQSSPENTQR